MSKKEKPAVKTCKHCKTEIPYAAKVCPQCRKKVKGGIFKWIVIAIVAIVLISSIAGSGDDSEKDTHKVGEVSSTADKNNTDTTPNSNENNKDVVADPAKAEYYVGDILEDGNTKIVFMSSGDYVEENEFLQPADGNKYIYLQFAFENISDSSDTSVSSYNFECFADGYATDMYYGGEEDLSATLSAGRSTTGYIYFEVPTEAKSIEVEYETNFFTEEKIKFIFEGNKDSGYVQETNTKPTENAYGVGDIVESSRLKITYLSCEEYESDNMFIVPADGYRFISCEFEFENIGSSDEYVSSFDFDCYADGIACKASFAREDDLSATLSAGRKTKGTVTFEVPLDATVIEVEYLSNYWTSNRVVFSVK